MHVTQGECRAQGGTLAPANPHELGVKTAKNGIDPIRRSPGERGFVYFIVCEDKYIKIGHSVDPASRFSTIQTDNPNELSLVYFERGTIDDERMYHDRFRRYHRRGEWFDLRGTLKGFIRRKSSQQQREFDEVA